jgi:hypothetical protein
MKFGKLENPEHVDFILPKKYWRKYKKANPGFISDALNGTNQILKTFIRKAPRMNWPITPPSSTALS